MRIAAPVVFVILLLATALFSRCGSDRSDGLDTLATPIASVLDELKFPDPYYRKKVRQKTEVFYRANEYQWYWLDKRSPNKRLKAFIEEANASVEYGLAPDDYAIGALEYAVDTLYEKRRPDPDAISKLDVRISAAFFLFTTHLLEGRVRYPGAREFLWKRDMPLENDIAILIRINDAGDLRRAIADLHPDHPQYEKLKEALAFYSERIPVDTAAPITADLRLRPGVQHQQVPNLRHRIALHDISTDAESDTFDEKLSAAVAEFQRRNDLKPTGMLNRATVRALNLPIEERVRQIALNLERHRWRPHIAGKEDEIVINVPEYHLRVYRNGAQEMQMRVVLGSEYNATPVFHDTLKYIVFSPTWAVPRSIFEEEFLPKLQEDPMVFDPERFIFYRNGEEIDPAEEKWDDKELDTSSYRVVETPGERNALGKVKFIMPNDFSIYLHDTPAQSLFGREHRALSHGCIRVERPVDLAMYMLDQNKKNKWNRKSITDAMNAGEPVQVNLEKPWPVYITYHTVRVDDDGHVLFFDDVYGHDRRQLQRMVTASAAAKL